MPTQKLFKQRVRARMTKTGESYTAARHQLLQRATAHSDAESPPAAAAAELEPEGATSTNELSVSDEAVRRASGKGHAEWFALLDAWGATDRTHTEIATWLREVQGVPGWWTQSITVDYERARGMRSRHQMADGFSVGATRTIAIDPRLALAAFTDLAIRERWLPGATLRQRPTRAANTARFDWSDPPSRVVVTIVPKDAGRSVVGVVHERIQDAADAARLKGQWRGWLGDLKAALERD